MPCSSAPEETGPPLFVFKHHTLPWRRVLRKGATQVETYADFLPQGSVVAAREEGGGVDSANFLSWARHFVDSVRDLTAGGRKVLLIYDGYRSHMSLAVLEFFKTIGDIVYALPAHTSGKTQPLDLVSFALFKTKLDELLSSVASLWRLDVIDSFEFCGIRFYNRQE